MFKLALISVLLAVFSTGCKAPAYPPPTAADGKPLLVVVEHDPWSVVAGSESPVFALYDNAVVIFLTDGRFRQIALDDHEFESLVSALNIDATFANTEPDYRLTRLTDQVTTLFFTSSANGTSRIAVYGSLREEPTRSKAPEMLLSMFDAAIAYHPDDAKTWLPDQVEVMIWPYDYAPEASIIWPSDWPGLDDPNTIQRGDSYSLFMPSQRLQELREFLAGRSPRGAVEIGGQKWAVSFRIPFPSEQLWMDSHQQ